MKRQQNGRPGNHAPGKAPSPPPDAALYAAAEKVTRNGAALRHALGALRTGRIAEAVVVLEAMEEGTHLSPTALEERTAIKHAQMNADAEARDVETIAAAYLADMFGSSDRLRDAV